MKRKHAIPLLVVALAAIAAVATALWLSRRVPSGEDFTVFADSATARIGLSQGPGNTGGASDTTARSETGYGEADDRDFPEYKNLLTAQAPAHRAANGILVVGEGKGVRAMMNYGGNEHNGAPYAAAANRLKAAAGDGVAVYCMVIPTAAAFYCPDAMRKRCHEQRPTILNVHARLAPDVRPVNVFTTLGQHAAEAIYLRTDHHWAPLGAYYAAERFAQAAGVPYPTLEEGYTADTVRRIVGSMYTFSSDAALRAAPEDFIYHIPRGVDYQATFIDYTVDEKGNVTGETRPHPGRFFARYKDGSGGAYCTLMGGDIKTVVVRTSTPGNRRLLLVKDSFGNALPAYLFHSFAEVHVVDYRYFTKNLTHYIRENGVTDVLIACNIFNACSPTIDKRIGQLLEQEP